MNLFQFSCDQLCLIGCTDWNTRKYLGISHVRKMGYYTVTRRYMNFIAEWQNYIFRTSAASNIMFLVQENKKIHIFKPPCNVLFIISTRVFYWKICRNSGDITRWREDIGFICKTTYFERAQGVKHCFWHEKIKFISSVFRVMFFLLYRRECFSGKYTKIPSSTKSRRNLEIMENKPLRCRMWFL